MSKRYLEHKRTKASPKNRKREFILIWFFFAIVLLVGGSYAYLQMSLDGSKKVNVVAGTFQIKYEDQETIKLENAYPMSDDEGKSLPSYQFSVENVGNINANYEVSLEEKEGSTLDKKYIRYILKKGTGEWSEPQPLSNLSNLLIEENKKLDVGEKETYEIKMWLDINAGNDLQGKTYETRVVVSAVQVGQEKVDVTAPRIKLFGELSINIEENEPFEDPGVDSVIDDRDELKVEDVEKSYEYYDGETTEKVENVDTSKIGVYYIYYRIKDQSGNEGVIIRSVNVYHKDTNPPKITLKGTSTIQVDLNEEYEELGAEAIDEEEGDISNRIVIEGVVNTKIIGTYVVKYIITDNHGNTASISRNVIVDKSILYNVLKKASKGEDTNVNFGQVPMLETSGVYEKSNQKTPIYYYRGIVENNNVLFGGFCWKMVRTTETGGVKLIYNGAASAEGTCNNTGENSHIGNSGFNAEENSPAYNGYMVGNVYSRKTKSAAEITTGMIYGNDVTYKNGKYILQDTYTSTGDWENTRSAIANKYHYTCFSTSNTCSTVDYIYYTGDSVQAWYIELTDEKKIEDAITEMFENKTDSTAKTKIDTWYEEHLKGISEEKFLEDAVYCNDRNISELNGWSKIGNANETMLIYKGRDRNLISYIPSLKCERVKDQFTVSNKNGNGNLEYPIGMLSADEATLAGSGYSYSNESYLNIGVNWWTMTGSNFWYTGAIAFYVNSDGKMHSQQGVPHSCGIRPVISLIAGVKVKEGDGTKDAPYKIDETVEVPDTENPEWKLENIEPNSRNIFPDEELQITFKGTDRRGTVTSKLTKENIAVKVNDRVVEPEKKELSNESENYTLTISGFGEQEGIVSIVIDANTLEDESKNENIETVFTTNVKISNMYRESILKGSDPVLGKNMIPVKIADSGEVTYVDRKEEWYKYQEQKWANAVILVDNPSNTKYKVGDHIEEKDIESYFVWIPRYKYQIFDVGNYSETITVDQAPSSIAKTINIEFQNKNDDKEEGSQKGEYLTHPAFTLGGKELSGIWVGKFETGYNQTGDGSNPITTSDWTNDGAKKDELNEKKIIVKPNVYSWRNITVSKIFMNAYKYNRNLDSHMMKNIEWGAVAYLSHSDYGTGKEVNVNNSIYLTGYSATANADQSSSPGKRETEEKDTQPYNTEIGYKASTTGNITGIYDMSGGAHEYMAAYRIGQNSTDSEVTDDMLDDYVNYFDVYGATTNWDDYSKRKLGDATGEMGPFYYYKDKDNNSRGHNAWYADNSYFVDSTLPWFHRGGAYDNEVLTGQFNFARYTGGAASYISSRLVLSF